MLFSLSCKRYREFAGWSREGSFAAKWPRRLGIGSIGRVHRLMQSYLVLCSPPCRPCFPSGGLIGNTALQRRLERPVRVTQRSARGPVIVRYEAEIGPAGAAFLLRESAIRTSGQILGLLVRASSLRALCRIFTCLIGRSARHRSLEPRAGDPSNVA